MTSIATLLSSVARRACCAAIYTSVLALLGCSSMAGVGGSAEFGCKAPVGVKCDSVSGTYYNALQQSLPSQQKSAPVAPDASAAPTLMDQLVGKRTTSAAYSAKDAAFVNTPVTALGASRDVSAPLRSAPRVLRLWIKHWEDSDGDLHSQSYVYVPIDAGHWLIDHYRSPPRQAHAPIKAPRSAEGIASTPGTAVTSALPRAAQDEAFFLGARAPGIAPASVPADGDADDQ